MTPRLGLAGCSFFVSALVLALEVAHIRLLSYATDPRLVYGAISIAFAGLGGGSIWVAMRPALARGDVHARLSRLCGVLALAIVGHALVFARISPSFSAASVAEVARSALPVLAVLAVPYVVAGGVLSIAAAAAGPAVHRVYAMSMAGSALGCFALFPFMRSIGLEGLLAVLGAGAALSGVLVFADARGRPWLSAAALAGCLLAVPFAERLMPFEPDPNDLLGIARKTFIATHPGHDDFAPARDFAGWDPVSRVEVFTFPEDFGLLNPQAPDGGAPIKLVTQDGGAGTILIDFEGHDDARRAWVERSVYATGYFVLPAPARVLVVGLGGGVDVVTALHHGAGHVTGVELNATILAVASQHFGAFQNDVLQRPDVALVHADGRSFIEHAQAAGRRWSLIQMSGADTYSAGSSGAFMFSESYLYTVEAFTRYLEALEPGGVLSLIRFGPEGLRTLFTAAEALRRLGVRDLDRHFVVLRQGICSGVAISREPLDDAAVARVLAGVARASQGAGVSLPMWEAMGFGIHEPIQLDYVPGHTPHSPFALALRAARDQRSRDALLERLELDFSPASDDKPFFFQFLKPKDWLRVRELGVDHFLAVGLLGHARLVAGFLLLAFVLTLAPLWSARRQLPGGRAAPLIYFACLGAGYMLVELALIQRTGLLLGHPTHSVSVTLATLLTGSGLGAMASTRWPPRRQVALAALAVAAMVVSYELALDRIVSTLLPLPWLWRALCLAALVFPLGFAMGMPFPVGLRRAARAGPTLVTWGLGINGFCGTLGSLLAVPLAMLIGFRAVMVTAVGVYAVAALVFWVTPSATASRRPPPRPARG